MSETERRRTYRQDRVLIESERVLDPQYADAVVFLSGAQIEMLRNATQYLRRIETYVKEHETGYYLTPTVEDYDSILAIVADLEETLMGNPNTIWGYEDRWSVGDMGTSTGTGYTDAEIPAVPAGYVYVLEHWTMVHADDVERGVSLEVIGGSGNQVIFYAPNVNPSWYEHDAANIPLKEGDVVRMRVFSLADTKTCVLTVWGHKMVVPE